MLMDVIYIYDKFGALGTDLRDRSFFMSRGGLVGFG